MATELSICNSALIKLGAERITTLLDESKEAQLCNEQYSKIRDELLYGHPWNFATVSETLTTNGNEHPWNGYAEYDIPSECLRILDFDDADMEWLVENGLLYCSDTEVNMRYIKQETDASLFSPKFSELLSLKLALELSYSMVQSAGIRETLNKEYQECLRDARSFDSQEGRPGRVDNNYWINVRT